MSDTAAPEPKVPLWKNPFLIAFLLGALFLTILPLMQRPFLKAPPPVQALSAWELPSLGGGATSSQALTGAVLLVTAELGPCDAACVERQQAFGRGVGHVDDLGAGKVVLLTLVAPEAKEGLAGVLAQASPAWRFATPSAALLVELQVALEKFTGHGNTRFGDAHAVVVIDQANAVRGYWLADVAGRGNSINAARLLAKHGPTP